MSQLLGEFLFGFSLAEAQEFYQITEFILLVTEHLLGASHFAGHPWGSLCDADEF